MAYKEKLVHPFNPYCVYPYIEFKHSPATITFCTGKCFGIQEPPPPRLRWAGVKLLDIEEFYEVIHKQKSEAAACPPVALLLIRGSHKKHSTANVSINQY